MEDVKGVLVNFVFNHSSLTPLISTLSSLLDAESDAIDESEFLEVSREA